MLKKIRDFVERLYLPNWLVILLFVTLILRIPSFFEPYYYGDEMIYMTLGQGIRQRIPLYSGLHDNKPPVLYLIAAAAGSLVWFKIFLAISGIVSIVFFAKIVKCLFQTNTRFQKISTAIFAFAITLPPFEGNIANAENFMIAFSLAAFYILLVKKPRFSNLFISGVLLSLALLTKVPALFDLPVVVLFWLITKKFRLKNAVFILSGFLIPIALTLAWFFLEGALPNYVTAAFMQNIGYLSSWRSGAVQKSFLIRNLPLFIRAFIVLAGVSITYIFRGKLSKSFILASVWLVLALFAATLSERPYPHYLLQAAAPISILFGILITSKNLSQSLTVIPLFLAFLVPAYYKFWYYPTTSYYLRFIKFAVGLASKEKYFSSFNKYTPRNYQIADFLVNSSGPEEKVFVWGPDSPSIHALSRRLPPIKYVADYHIKDYSTKSEVACLLNKNKPKFIILTPEAEIFPQLNPLLRSGYLLINKIEGAEIWTKLR